MRRLAFLRTGPVPIANVSLERALGDRLDGWDVVTVDVKDLIRRSPRRAMRLAAAAAVRYHGHLAAGHWSPRDALLRTRTSNLVIRDLIRRELRSLDVDAVLQMQSLFDGRLPGVPHLVYTDHLHLAGWGSVGQWGRRRAVPSWVVAEAALYERADAVLLRTEAIRGVLVDRYGVGRPRPAMGPPMVLFVGIDWERKGGDLLVAAMSDVRRSHPEARLVTVGDAPADLPAWVESAGRIPVEEIGRFYRQATVFCLPSRQESFGVAVIEAMAAGVPCVVSDVGSLPEMVGPGGVVVPVDERAALAEALSGLLDDRARAARLGAAARERVVSRYSWGLVAGSIASVLDEVTGPESPTRVPQPTEVAA